MRIRSFGLLQLGPLPLGAFAEPEGEELFKAPRRERQRMFVAGPATNLFASLVLLILLGGIAGHFATWVINQFTSRESSKEEARIMLVCYHGIRLSH